MTKRQTLLVSCLSFFLLFLTGCHQVSREEKRDLVTDLMTYNEDPRFVNTFWRFYLMTDSSEGVEHDFLEMEEERDYDQKTLYRSQSHEGHFFENFDQFTRYQVGSSIYSYRNNGDYWSRDSLSPLEPVGSGWDTSFLDYLVKRDGGFKLDDRYGTYDMDVYLRTDEEKDQVADLINQFVSKYEMEFFDSDDIKKGKLSYSFSRKSKRLTAIYLLINLTPESTYFNGQTGKSKELELQISYQYSPHYNETFASLNPLLEADGYPIRPVKVEKNGASSSSQDQETSASSQQTATSTSSQP